ncbi:MAG: hypothetical protein N3A69_15835, partial [Leptospiraceae bacterium]|nr:hypothetical protein [Leptospiraceae bacterium]
MCIRDRFYGEFNNKNPNITNYKKTARPCEGVEEMNYDDCETEETFKIKASGIQIYHKAGYEWGEEEVFFPNMQEIEGYLLLRECCHQENRLITYSEYKNMLENGVPIPEFQDTLYLSCRVKKKAGGISLGISFAL